MPKPSPTCGLPPKVSETARPASLNSVEQPPQAVEHAEHPSAAVCRPGHHRVEEPEIPVVVADQPGAAGQHRRLRAAGQERRRVPQRQRTAAASGSSPSRAVSRCHVGTSSGMCSPSRAPACSAVGRVFAPSSHHRRNAGQVAARCAPISSPGSSSSKARRVSETHPGVPPAGRPVPTAWPATVPKSSPSRRLAGAMSASLTSRRPPPTAASPANSKAQLPVAHGRSLPSPHRPS